MAQRHPRRLLAAFGIVLLGTGATAFAVATLVPDASQVPVRQITEQVSPLAISAAASEEQLPAYVLYRSETTRSNDSADSLLRRLGVIDAGAVQFIKSDATARTALLSRAGRAVTAEVNATHGLVKLSARWTPDDSNNFQRLVIERKNDLLTSRVETAPLAASTRLASGVIKSSLFAATDEARIPDSVAVQLAEIFSGDIDFIRALRKGDRFSVVYESLEADGEPMRAGRVLSADFVNNGKMFSAVWFQEKNAAKGQYYTLDGTSLWQPRIGFNLALDPTDRSKGQLRGGVGLFQGEAASVWLSNPYSNTGVVLRTVGCGSGTLGACPGTDGLFKAG